jgi:septal ring-binding cell division protein DamX
MNPIHSPAGLALSLVGDVRSLGLVSQMDAPLKNFSKRLLACIRSIDDAVVIEEYRGHEFLSLISRLNQEVAPYLLQQELPFEGSQSLHIWVIDQAHLLSTEQQSIIFRLIELFPGLPFRVIWLSSQPLQTWKNHAKTECIFLDLDAVDPSAMNLPTPEDAADPVDTAVPENLDEPIAQAQAFPWPSQPFGKKAKIAAAMVGAGLLGTWLWMSSSSPTPSAPEVTTSPVAQAATPASEASGASTAPAASAPAATQTASEPSKKAKASEPAHKSVEAPKPTTTNATKTLPEVALAGGRWLKALPADTYVVEHGSFSGLEQAQKLKGKHSELKTARIIAVRKTPHADDLQFTVITGPFRSEERAKTYVSRLDWKSGTRIRGTDKLKPLVASAP